MNILGALGFIFIILKLVGTVDWSWWIVLSPFIAVVILYLLTIALALIIIKICGMEDTFVEKIREKIRNS